MHVKLTRLQVADQLGVIQKGTLNFQKLINDDHIVIQIQRASVWE
jgi:hypothetical protein